jgi:hypothetical protein
MHVARRFGYRAPMLTYAIIVLVLVGIILLAAALLDRRRAREIDRDLTDQPSDTTPGRHRG